jgi:hypothetical protein
MGKYSYPLFYKGKYSYPPLYKGRTKVGFLEKYFLLFTRG